MHTVSFLTKSIVVACCYSTSFNGIRLIRFSNLPCPSLLLYALSVTAWFGHARSWNWIARTQHMATTKHGNLQRFKLSAQHWHWKWMIVILYGSSLVCLLIFMLALFTTRTDSGLLDILCARSYLKSTISRCRWNDSIFMLSTHFRVCFFRQWNNSFRSTNRLDDFLVHVDI